MQNISETTIYLNYRNVSAKIFCLIVDLKHEEAWKMLHSVQCTKNKSISFNCVQCLLKTLNYESAKLCQWQIALQITHVHSNNSRGCKYSCFIIYSSKIKSSFILPTIKNDSYSSVSSIENLTDKLPVRNFTST